MLKMPKEDSKFTASNGIIWISDRQQSKKDPAPKKSTDWHDELLNMVSMASHDIRGSVVSIASALKLIRKGFYGKINEGASNEIEKMLEKLAGIIGIVEDSMSRSLCLSGELDRLREELDLLKAVTRKLSSRSSPNIVEVSGMKPESKAQTLSLLSPKIDSIKSSPGLNLCQSAQSADKIFRFNEIPNAKMKRPSVSST